MDRHRSSEKSFLAFVVLTFSSLFSYPSGRLAILRLRSPLSTVVFFDDTESVGDRFLGSITSQGHLTVQSGKASRRRLFTDEQNRSILSFDEEKGSIQREHQWNSEDQQRTALQIQLNSSIELHYRDPTDIRLTFTCDKEEYRLQLGVKSDLPSPTPKKHPRPSSPFAALVELKVKVQQICHDWLEHSRTMLGKRTSRSSLETTFSLFRKEWEVSLTIIYLIWSSIQLSRRRRRRRREDFCHWSSRMQDLSTDGIQLEGEMIDRELMRQRT